MDISDANASDSAMIALLPTTNDWCNIDLPHLTLVYAGLTADLKPSDFNEMAKDAAMLAAISSPVALKVMAKETFGPSRDTDVFTLMPTPELWAMRRAVESWNKSQFPFNPHVTIGPTGTFVDVVPRAIGFNRIMVAFGDEQLTFWMKNSGSY